MPDTVHAGTAVMPITPPAGSYLQGYRRDVPCSEIRDHLYARAIVIDDGLVKSAIVSVDIVGLEYDSVLKIRRRVRQLCDVPPSHVMITTSHTHAGPAVMYLGGMPIEHNYVNTLERHIAGVVAMASQDMKPVTIRSGIGSVDFNINRRLLTPDGVQMLPNPTGVVDKRVRVIRIDSDSHEPLAVLFSYTCHPTTLGGVNNRVSGDYPGAAARMIERIYNGRTAGIFLPGCFGDIRPNLTNIEGHFRGATDAELDSTGRLLATEVVRVAEDLALPFHPSPTGTSPGIAVASSRIRLPYVNLPKVSEIREMCRSEGPRYERLYNLVLSRKRKGYAAVEISGLRLGDLSLVMMPGEVMLEIGQQVEAGLDGDVIVLGYTNGNPGYLCTRASYDEGGYEPNSFFRTYLHPAKYTRETEKILVRTGIRIGRKVWETTKQ